VEALVLSLHDWVRWILLAAGVLSAVITGLTWIRHAAANALDKALSGAFIGLLDLQWLLGVALFLMQLGDPGLATRAFHGGAMTVAALSAHLVRARARGAPDEEAAPHYVVSALLPLLIIALALRLWYA